MDGEDIPLLERDGEDDGDDLVVSSEEQETSFGGEERGAVGGETYGSTSRQVHWTPIRDRPPPFGVRAETAPEAVRRIKSRFPDFDELNTTFSYWEEDGEVKVKLTNRTNAKTHTLIKKDGEVNWPFLKSAKTVKIGLGLGAEVVESNNERILKNEVRITMNKERIAAIRRAATRNGSPEAAPGDGDGNQEAAPGDGNGDQEAVSGVTQRKEPSNCSIQQTQDRLQQLKDLEEENEGLERENDELRNENEAIQERMPLKERVRAIFTKYGFTVFAVVAAIGTTLGVILSSLKSGLGRVASGVGNGLKELGKKLGQILPGIVGAVASFVFRIAGEVVGFLAKNAWLLVVAVVVYFVEQLKKKG